MRKKRFDIKKFLTDLEKKEKGKFILFCCLILLIFIAFGFMVGYSIRKEKINRFRKWERKFEKEVLDSLNKKYGENYYFLITKP